MSSVISKVNKSRSTGAPKPAVRKAKKAVSVKGKPKRVAASAKSTPKPKKRSVAHPASAKDASARNASIKSVSAKGTSAKNKNVLIARSALKKSIAKGSTKPASKVISSRPKIKAATESARVPKRSATTRPAPGRVSERGVPAKPATARGIGKSTGIKSATSKPIVAKPAARPAPKPAPHQEPRTISPDALQAIRAFERALTEFNRQDFDTARGSFQAILAKFRDQTDVIARSRTYLAICEQRLARVPAAPRNNPDALYNQGVFEFNRGNTREAIDIFRKALKASPRADHILYSLAAAYTRAGDPAGAMDALRRAIAMNHIHRSHARHDPDFASLRGNREFRRLSGMPIELPE